MEQFSLMNKHLSKKLPLTIKNKKIRKTKINKIKLQLFLS